MSGQPGRPSEIWEEGEEFRRINSRIRDIQSEKTEIEKLKRNKKAVLRSYSGFSQNKSRDQRISLPLVPDAFGVLGEQTEYDLEESEYNNVDKNEMKEIYQFKLRILDNEEKRLKEDLMQLEREKVRYVHEYKRIRDEEFSKYCGIQTKG
jgi:hypothetical protein